MDSYTAFLAGKAPAAELAGLDTSGLDFNPALKDFQRFIVETALQKGRYALFEDCGLGKTLQQLEWARHIVAHTGRPVLVLTPLAVAAQTIAEGEKFGIPVWRLQPEFTVANAIAPGIFVTNYEQIENIDPTVFSGVVLDESSILKNFTGQTKRLLLNYFSQTPYRLCCTATPSPNDHMELGNHAEFLGVMPSNEMVSRWFINDTMKMGTYRLKHHAETDFWQWVASWAMCISSPRDINFDASGYDLPALELSEELVQVSAEAAPGTLFADTAVTATTFNAGLKATIEERLTRVVELVQARPDEPFLIWINLNEEGKRLRELLPEAVEVSGSDKVTDKEKNLLGFANGEFRILITKKKIAQFGLNFQHCRNQVFASLDFSFEGVYQAIRRSYRFGQTQAVRVHLITVPTMGNVLKSIKEKQAAFEQMQRQMSIAISATYLPPQARRTLALDFTHQVEQGPGWTMHLGDCCEVVRQLPDESVDFGIHSPPFANLYIYSDSVRDMGNCRDDAEFFEQYRFLIAEHLRILKPGRLVAVHCKNLVDYQNSAGRAGQRDFRGDIIRAYEAEGFKYHAEVTIEKDPVIEMQRTKANGLLYKTLRKDSSFTRTGMAEYLLVFRKWPRDGEEAARQRPINWKTEVNYQLNKWQVVANPIWPAEPTKEDLLEMLYHQSRQLDAVRQVAPELNLPAPAWHDIQQTNVLNIQQARESRDEKHICPLQLDVIEKAVELWTNPGDVVFTPFAGIGSELYQSIKMGRQAVGIELKDSYFAVAARNCRNAVAGKQQLSIFEVLEYQNATEGLAA